MDERTLVASYEWRYEAEMALSALEEQGIVGVVEAEDAGGAHPALGLSLGGVRVYVRPEDAATAQEILGTLPRAGPSPRMWPRGVLALFVVPTLLAFLICILALILAW